MSGIELLYVHPSGHLNDVVVPAGALSVMNAVPVPKLGRFAFEVTDEELQAARVVALDLHWAFGLTGLAPMVARIRRVNPAARIVVGGITASHYPRRLLEDPGVDYAIQGDSEVAFRTLVLALLGGDDPGPIANVHARGAPPPPLARMSHADFDATDVLTVDWFPTYARLTDLPAEAFPAGRTLPVARGCPLACAMCYGSFGATFGKGVLHRSPEGVAREVVRAGELGVGNLRLILGRIPASRLEATIEAVARARPRPLPTGAGLYLCTPPTAATLDALEAAFPGGVDLSAVDPGEHLPAPGPERLAETRDGWRAVADAVRRHPGPVVLDYWVMTPAGMAPARERLGGEGRRQVQVNLGSVWNVTRPRVGHAPGDLEAVRGTVAESWSFFAARLLAPALAPLLAPFRLLDEVDGDPEAAGALPPPARAWQAPVLAAWRRHCLPLLSGLVFHVVDAGPARAADPLPADPGRPGPVRLEGDLRLGRTRAPPAPAPVPLARTTTEAGVRLEATLVAPDGAPLIPGARLALVPGRPDGSPPDADWVREVAAAGWLVLTVPEGARALASVTVDLRVQAARVTGRDAAGEVVARAFVDFAYFDGLPAATPPWFPADRPPAPADPADLRP